MSEESSNRSTPYRSPSYTPPYSLVHSQFSNLIAQQRYMHEQMDNLTAQMAANYHYQAQYLYEPQYQPRER